MKASPQQAGRPSLGSERSRACAPMGVSVVVCCHNSAKRLPQTLAHLASQLVPTDIPWEVIVIDNASIDDTTEVARGFWPDDSPAPLRIVFEPRLGLGYARHRGLTEARYECVSFVDDDNWVGPEWVRIAAQVMSEQPNIGACGGFSEAVCDVTAPWWLGRVEQSYAVGPNGVQTGDVTETRGLLWGAGLTIRKSAWLQLVNNGFSPFLVGRKGKALSSGEDAELCLALRLAGWRLWYEQRLCFRHFLPPHRLEWRYLRRMLRGSGASTVRHDPYYFALGDNRGGLKGRLRRTWQWQTLSLLRNMLRQPGKILSSFLFSLEGDPEVLRTESQIGRLLGLIRTRKTYRQAVRQVLNARWKQSS